MSSILKSDISVTLQFEPWDGLEIIGSPSLFSHVLDLHIYKLKALISIIKGAEANLYTFRE